MRAARIEIDDPQALLLYRQRLMRLKAKHEAWKLGNAVIRDKSLNRDKRVAKLRGAGMQHEEARDFIRRGGAEPKVIQGLITQIRQVELKIEFLESVRYQAYAERELAPGITEYFDPQVMRFGVMFDGATPPEHAAHLARRGYRFSPTADRWQRKITPSYKKAIRALREYFRRASDEEK